MVAVHLACKSLQRGETNFALACGVNLLLHPFDGDLMPMVISPDGHCKTFDAKANGFARAEGCGVLVLKRLSDAVRDEDKIWALIRGSGMTQEGVSKSMGTPTIHCESLAMTLALKDARVDPAQVSYVEAHGTGTMVGDPMEVASIAQAYHTKEREQPLLIGSVKTNVGHTESCSGITGIMKVVLALQNEIIPAHRNFETLNPAIDLDSVPAVIPLKPVEWKKQDGKPRFAGVSSFGITGTDAHAIIEETPAIPSNGLKWNPPTLEQPLLRIMKISTKTEEAMDILLEKYKKHLKNNNTDLLPDLAYTANVGRSDFNQRTILIAESNEKAAQMIEDNKLLRGEATPEALGKVCFLFTGQGSQYPGMGKQLYDTSPVFRMHFEYCDNLLKNIYNIDIKQVLWPCSDKATEISRTIYSQTSIFAVEYALLKLWESWGVKPDYALGHSLGEFAAAVCSGMLTVEDALKLVAERSRLIDQLPRGKMLVIKADKTRVDTAMKKFAGADENKILDCAAINSPEQTVLAGDSQVVLQFGLYCKENGLKCIVLEATHAFHSKHMDPMLNEYRNVAKTVIKLEGDSCQYISGMKGTIVDADQVDAEYWVEHTRKNVLFMNASKKAVELGCKTFIEIGPQPVLVALTMMNNDIPLSCLPSLKRNEGEWETLLTTLGKLYVKGLEIDWKGVEQFYERKKVSLPHYPFIGKKFWPDMMSVSGVSIHPLLGSVLSNPSSLKLFQSGLNLRSLEYVKDHAIGDNIIFPGAGFLEICLAAGLATIEASTESLSPPTRSMKIENLTIEAPLALQESSTCQIQTLAELNTTQQGEKDWNDISIKIFRKNSLDSSKWQLHAKATFCPLPTMEDREEFPFDSEHFLSTLETPSEEESIVKQVYDKLASVGLKFGPTFRSIDKVWREDDEEKKVLVAKVNVPPKQGAQENYIIHPVVLDAMIQAIMMIRPLSNLKKTLYVPIKIGKFVWISGTDDDDNTALDLYVRAVEQGPTASATLVTSSGKVLGVMSSVELIDTTVKAIESVLEQQTSALPDMWEEVWRKHRGATDSLFDLSPTTAPFFTNEYHKEFEDEFNKHTPAEQQTFKNVEKLAYLNFLRALYELEWKPELGKTFSESSLFNDLNIKPNFRQYFSFICDVLEAEGILQNLGKSSGGSASISETNWKLVQVPPSNEDILGLLTSPELSITLTQQFEPTPLLQKVGESLSSFFKGEISPLSILFPEGQQTYPSLNDFYSFYGQFSHIFDCVILIRKMLEHISKTIESFPNAVIRILEVGAGTGSYTSYVLDILEKQGISYEYTYTDVSVSFFQAAEKKFEKYLKGLRFKKFNLEEDPIVQGFTPEYFDVVLACEVIHATKNISESLQNIRMLMKPHARMIIQETTRVNRILTFLFGTLEGYWRFQDFELRQRNCIMEKEKWVGVLERNEFSVEGIFFVFQNYSSLIFAQRTPKGATSQRIREKIWLLFHHPGNPISESLLKKIGEVEGRKVLEITEGDDRRQELNGDGVCAFSLRGREYDDFQWLFETLIKCGVEIEGVIYCWALGASTTAQQDLLQPYFNLTKCLLSQDLKVLPRLTLVSKGVLPIGENELSRFHASTLIGYSMSMKNEYLYFNCRTIEVLEDALVYDNDEATLQNIFHEIWNTDKEPQKALSKDFLYVPKLQAHKAMNNALKLPAGTDRFHLILPESKSISDLQFGPLDLPSCDLKENEVEIQIKASALNFRDVLSVIKPTEQFKDSNAVGFDVAGVVRRVGSKVTKWKVGDRIGGCNAENSALPSHAIRHQDTLILLPDNMTFCEAATIPAVYITSVVCLIETAKIKKGDVVLIHTATGGVGLSAIEICKHFGCTIIATAGSKRKQNYLRGLGIQHIFHSRNTKYGDQILQVTNGRGVDVVLNSLTSDGFKEATLKACAKNARFVEMSKLNIWTEEHVKELRPDVNYTIIDISSADASEWIRFTRGLNELMEKGVVKPIPYVRFDGQNIREALQYMQKAKHIGKVVCVLPELRSEDGKIEIYTPMFNDNVSYLITGGLGGIGFVVCQWMIEMGAKHIILAGRRSPSPQIQMSINEMNSKGANVIPVQLDVGDFNQCKELVQNKMVQMNLPQLKGIMHAAGTLSDGLIANQDWKTLSSTFNTKIDGTLNLHELTKHLNLEHFVLFSSMAGLFGPPGQSNHAAGNIFEDKVAHYRHSVGLPATTINWGQWGEVGIAKEMDLPGIKPFSNVQGIAGLEYAMKTHRIQTCVLNVESFVLLTKISPQISVYLDERVWKASVGASASTLIKSEEFWQQYDSLTNTEEKINLVEAQLHKILRNTLKLDDTDVIDNTANIQEMGVDSLMFVEIKNGIQTMLGERLVINASAIKDCNTVNLLGTTLVKLIEGEEDNLKPTLEEVNELIREDCQLPEHISAKECQKSRSIREISTVLLTGCTGTLGPYVLKQLVQVPQIKKVVCLIRPSKTESVEERLRKVLENLELSVDMSKVECISGDVGDSHHLGMEEGVWKRLSVEIEAIFHCGARVEHTEHYRKRNSAQDSRAVNIGGMKNILTFACEKTLKHVYNASSLLASATIDDGLVSERWPEMGEYDDLTTYAYPISKYVGDILIKQAVERGIPAKTFRFPLIVGENGTGRCSVQNNHALLRFMFIMKNGIMPDNPLPMQILPVDICAEVSVRIFFEEKATSHVYNLMHAYPDTDQEFVSIAKRFGCHVETVEFEEFAKRIQEAGEKDGEAMTLFKDLYNDVNAIMSVYANAPVLKKWMEGGEDSQNVWRCNNVPAIIPDFFEGQKRTMEYVYDDLCFCKKQGWFEKFGI